MNEKKTQVLCIHSNNHSQINSYIRTDDGEINSSETLKILGFQFDSKPNAVYHVTETINKFYSKLWTLRFLRKSGMRANDLQKIYSVIIRPAVEYCSIVYHTLIPEYMSDRLEMVQKQAISFSGHISDRFIRDVG